MQGFLYTFLCTRARVWFVYAYLEVLQPVWRQLRQLVSEFDQPGVDAVAKHSGAVVGALHLQIAAQQTPNSSLRESTADL